MSKTKKRVLSVLALLFAVALVFTACFALTGCGDSDEGGTETTTTGGTKLTVAVPEGVDDEGNALTLVEGYTAGSWVYRYNVLSYEPGGVASMMGRDETTGPYYVFIFETGQILFGNEDDYEMLITIGYGSGTDGTWTYTDGAFEFVCGSNTTSVDDNEDGTVTITVVSSNWGTYIATIDPSDFAG